MRALFAAARASLSRLFRRRPSLDRLNRLAANLQHALRVGDCCDIQRAHRAYESELRLWTRSTATH